MTWAVAEHEVVRLRREIEGFPTGTHATVVHLNTNTDFILEIVGEQGEHLGLIDVKLDDFEKTR